MVRPKVLWFLCFLVLLLALSKNHSANSFITKKSIPSNFRTRRVSLLSVPNSNPKPWARDGWRSKNNKGGQIPEYPDQVALEEVESQLRSNAPLVFAGEVRNLQKQLAEAMDGKGFLLMGGDCAESFKEFSVSKVRDTYRVILQMALILTFGGSRPVIKVGRMAGQFAKPRSSLTEVVNGTTLPSYRGDNVNRQEATLSARTPDPSLMLKAYHQCTQTVNLLRAFSTGGYADISRLHAWNLGFVNSSAPGSMYRSLAEKVDDALRFIQAIGVDTTSAPFTSTDFFVSHEALLLPYEETLTRIDSLTGYPYACSAHMLWVGERTRDLEGPHVEFARGVNNPIGIKLSAKCAPDELIKLINRLNPSNEKGKIVLIVRMGCGNIKQGLPPLINAVKSSNKHVLWVSDPMHGNTVQTKSGKKTRHFEDICKEVMSFFDIHHQLGTHPGGMHIEMTGAEVTECIGGGVSDVKEGDLSKQYTTKCDPRLNAYQSIELAFLVAYRMRENLGLPPLVEAIPGMEL